MKDLKTLRKLRKLKAAKLSSAKLSYPLAKLSSAKLSYPSAKLISDEKVAVDNSELSANLERDEKIMRNYDCFLKQTGLLPTIASMSLMGVPPRLWLPFRQRYYPEYNLAY